MFRLIEAMLTATSGYLGPTFGMPSVENGNGCFLRICPLFQTWSSLKYGLGHGLASPYGTGGVFNGT